MHFLGDDIRGKLLDELEYRKKFDALIVGSYAATRWVPDATAVIPPGLDLRDYEPTVPVERERPLVVHAPSDLEKKGTRHVIAACAQLPVDLDVVHGVPHEEAVERFKRADIVVDQMNYLWHGVFAIESMAYGKPVVTHLDPEAVAQTEEAFGVKVPIVSATKDDLVEKLRPLVDSFELRRQLGQEGRAYVDKVDGDRSEIQQGPIMIAGETDRVYQDTTAACLIDDPALGRRITVAKAGSRSTVVWNPWRDKARRLADFGDDEYPRMVGVEVANALGDTATVAPGAAHRLQTTISVT